MLKPGEFPEGRTSRFGFEPGKCQWNVVGTSSFYQLVYRILIGVYVMPVASPFYLLIGDGSIGVYVMPLTSKRIFVTLGLSTWR
ncbi:hypothetical protein DQR00_18625 [Salmonella enterica subsp. salamae serovar Sofia]|nr:hypothetical protein [Salmonella enterica subsp. salamae serovar Sofia]EBU7540195.1 hypothetical protein [Salmonella enterica subsp. salamae serovar Sofia]EBW7590957.1 hypothetical protein [Salmonella enterica subsp. salamae serovar Sofia]EBX1463992.1 hypothetical protein [Salmonella enterica subsp. salamae serovar Sofia]EBX6688201.1 hypothetical protein [Salmonella enterica subsp. salamae serovar Sofia]